MRLFRFFISRTFWIQLGLALVLGVVGFMLLNVGLKGYTRHGQSIEVPDVKGQGREAAMAVITGLGMHPVVIDSLYRAGGEPGAVVEQDPIPGTEVKGMRNVYLTVYRATPPNEEVGIEEGMDPGVARILLEMKGFEFEERFAPSELLIGLVLGVENEAGEMLGPKDRVPKNAELVLVIGESSNRFVSLPNLRDMAYADALKALKSADLRVGNIKWLQPALTAVDSARAKVAGQSCPSARGGTVRAGAEVDLEMFIPDSLDAVLPTPPLE